jgi:hypothetical protein
MKKLMLGLVCMLVAAKGMACSMEVNHNYTKNLLIAHAASYNDVFLPNAIGVSVAEYGVVYEGGAGGGSCPDYMEVTGRVSLGHKPSAFSECSYEVTVTHRMYIGSDVPDGPMEEVSFSDATAACSTHSGLRRVRKIPPRVKIPIRLAHL